MKFFVLAASVGVAMARPDGAGGHHDHGHSAHAAPAASASGYQEPSAGYSAPGSGYAEPASGYEQPSGYEQSSGYEVDPYQTSGYGAVEEGGFNLSMLILPVMILAGLALLFPSVTTVTVRKKRSAEDEVSGNSLADRVQDIYMSVVESEECMERIACEMGGIVADAGISKDIFKAAAPLVSGKFSAAMKQFNYAKDCKKIKCGTFY